MGMIKKPVGFHVSKHELIVGLVYVGLVLYVGFFAVLMVFK